LNLARPWRDPDRLAAQTNWNVKAVIRGALTTDLC
jgi:hypothetical protein